MFCLVRSSHALIRPRSRPCVFLARDELVSLRYQSADTNTSASKTDGELSDTTHNHTRATFDIPLIQTMRPFTPWLEGEMRSNHAGETGAVNIYKGAIKALDIRRSLGLSYGDARKGQLSYEDRLRAFALEHQDSEQHHVDLLGAVLDGDGISILLPAWRMASFTLGFASTIFCPRGMYLTTEAVETFVEEHYMAQIRRLRYEAAGTVLCNDDGKDADENGTRTSLKARAELIVMLEHCCADEVYHKEKARERAAEGPFPWFAWVDTSWQWFVQTGSAVAANCAKRI